MGISHRDSLVIVCGNMIPSQNETVRNLERFIESDGFLYFKVQEMQAYGSQTQKWSSDIWQILGLQNILWSFHFSVSANLTIFLDIFLQMQRDYG